MPSTERLYFAHESSYLDEPCNIGEGTMIWHFCHVMKNARIGENCRIGQNVFIASDVVIGNNVKIQNNVSVYTGVTLEDDVFCGPSCVFTNVLTPRAAIARNTPEHYQKTLVKRGATIGANATVVCGVTIGEHAFIGAGSVVTRDVPPYALVYGNPSRVRGWACACGARLQFEQGATTCDACSRPYIFMEWRVLPVQNESDVSHDGNSNPCPTTDGGQPAPVGRVGR